MFQKYILMPSVWLYSFLKSDENARDQAGSQLGKPGSGIHCTSGRDFSALRPSLATRKLCQLGFLRMLLTQNLKSRAVPLCLNTLLSHFFQLQRTVNHLSKERFWILFYFFFFFSKIGSYAVSVHHSSKWRPITNFTVQTTGRQYTRTGCSVGSFISKQFLMPVSVSVPCCMAAGNL